MLPINLVWAGLLATILCMVLYLSANLVWAGFTVLATINVWYLPTNLVLADLLANIYMVSATDFV
jgi:hypothetical protein